MDGLDLMTRRLLVSWVGAADLRTFAASPEGDDPENLGPIRNLLARERFDEVHLLSNYDAKESRVFAKALEPRARLHKIRNLKDPTCYTEVFKHSEERLKLLMGQEENAGAELCIHLSSGTPTMAAVWVLLGKSRYPARFYQTYRSGAREETVPFDLVLDFVPEVLKGPDRHFLTLSARSPQEIEGFERVIGDSKALRQAVERARRAALRSVPVLLAGESGTGKEIFARAMHAGSARRGGPFVPINCAAIPGPLLEAELFGYKKGAFTGADGARAGAFEEADGGTLFLDEVGECEPAMQAKLLRVLQPPPGCGPSVRELRRLGSSKTIRVDVRILSATNRDLVEEVRAHRFREDLYYRLAVITVKLPPLRERARDVPLLAEHFLEQINADFAREDPAYRLRRLSEKARRLIGRYPWPGNVRQLYNTLLQGAVMSEGPSIREADLSEALSEAAAPGDNVLERPLGNGFRIEALIQELRAHYIRRALGEAGGNKAQATRLLGMNNWQTLDAQIKKLGIEGA